MMKLKNLIVAAMAIVALAACSNNDVIEKSDGIDSDLLVSIKLPKSAEVVQSTTRGVIGDNDNITTPPKVEITSVFVNVKNGNNSIASKLLEGSELIDANKDNLVKLILKSSKFKKESTIEVVLNNGLDLGKNIKIEDIQQENSTKSVAKAIYKGVANEIIKNKDGNYSATVTVTSIISRVEVFGTVNFNNKVVKSAKLAYVSPIGYSTIHGEQGKITMADDKSNVLGLGGIVYKDNKLYTLSSSGKEFELSTFDGVNKAPEANKAKAIVNHLFAGDPTGIYIGLLIDSYERVRDPIASDNYLNLGSSNPLYVYRSVDGKSYYSFDGSSWSHVNQVGNTFTKGELIKGNIPQDLLSIKELRFYTLKEFGSSKDKLYQASYSYLLDLSKIKWNAENKLNPDVNPGREHPDRSDKESTLDIDVKVQEWKQTTGDIAVDDKPLYEE